MFPWPFPRRVGSSVVEPFSNPEQLPVPAPCLSDLARFDTFTPAEVRALPKRLRGLVIADRKRRVTAALVRVAAGKALEW